MAHFHTPHNKVDFFVEVYGMGSDTAPTGCLSPFRISSSPSNFNHQKDEIAPLRVALVNIMDNAAGTERHFLRTIGAAHSGAEIILCRMACAKKDHKYFDEQDYLLSDRYVDWHDVIGVQDIDLVIVTGINRGTLSYSDLERKYPDFWAESQDLFGAIRRSIHTGMTGHAALVCWSAFAAMKTLYGVEKGIRPQKLYGLFDHQIESPDHPLTNGFGPAHIMVPQSRYSYMHEDELRQVIAGHDGTVVMSGPDGPAIWTLDDNRMTCFINHLEYSIETLAKEYHRDRERVSPDFPLPQNYSPENMLSSQNIATFGRLAKTCNAFYKNLIDMAHTQKQEIQPEQSRLPHPSQKRMGIRA